MSAQLHASAALPQGKSQRYLLDGSVDGPQSRSGGGSEEKNVRYPPRTPVVQSVAQSLC